MRICIDSCVFISGLTDVDPAAVRLLNLVGPDLVLVVPRLVVQEVTRNLQTPEQVRRFMGLFHQSSFAFLVDDLAPRALVKIMSTRGCRKRPTRSSALSPNGWL
jgi:hypothetical protein